jgi:hypothetical protein
MVKKCGVLRTLCGVLFHDTPQDNPMSSNRLKHLRSVADLFSIPTRVRARARVCVGPKNTPQHPAWTLISSLFDYRAAGWPCGVFRISAQKPSANPPQTLRKRWGWAS